MVWPKLLWIWTASTLRKVSKYGVFSGSYSVRMPENTDQKRIRIWTLFTQWRVNCNGKKTTLSLTPCVIECSIDVTLKLIFLPMNNFEQNNRNNDDMYDSFSLISSLLNNEKYSPFLNTEPLISLFSDTARGSISLFF